MGIHHIAAAAAAAAAVVSYLAPGSAAAQQAPASARTIPWYQAHSPEREAVLRACRTTHAYGRNIDCLNADTAGTLDWGRRSAEAARHGSRDRGLFPQLRDPTYWAENRLARTGVLAACNSPRTGYAPSTCAAARQGEALDARKPS